MIESVLIVDDDDRVTAAIARTLGSNRVIHIAHDIETALALVRDVHPDLVVVDLRLGNSSGIDLIKALKAEAPDTAVALVSGYLSTDITVMAVKAGADVVLSKPFTGRELLRRIAGDLPPQDVKSETPSLAEVESEHIARVLTDCENNVSEAARRLGIYRSSLQRKLRKRDPRMS